ncbi:MAG: Asp-tRNA(Asn)/Glu-tRNA(Gln) amidotransferase subunit GatB [Candidatus Coatesbacteria bacterium]|nr:Asp-tRNA(Asn)/Glu-tRNA(Gln) amidotransferase subunit GatB [Candidatus Coatesbacteria bacterium]
MEFIITIGLEIHAQLLTESKMFCRCPNNYGDIPNRNICPVCLGYPGILPVPNEKALEHALKLGFATKSRIEEIAYFARKNYFYPDLPKGYQITQYENPICTDGKLKVPRDKGEHFEVRIRRIHLEEDAGKNFHPENEQDEGISYIDYNRGGIPLVEIVTEPDLHSGEEAYLFLNKLKQLLEYLEVCSGDMEKGALRCDVNIDVARNEKEHGVIVEIKNMNSFSNVRKAIDYEAQRQIDMLEKGEMIFKETRTWDERISETRLLRRKEKAEDYRYFPEPDLIPVRISDELKKIVKENMPALPSEIEETFKREYNLSDYISSELLASKQLSQFYVEGAAITEYKKELANWLLVEYLRVIKEKNLDIRNPAIGPADLVELVELACRGEISQATGKEILPLMAETGKKAKEIVEEKGLKQISDKSFIRELVINAVEGNPKVKEQYISGKEAVYGFFIGQVMKATKGKADPSIIDELLKEYLSSLK